MRPRAWFLLGALLALAGVARLAAHSAPGSALLLDFQGAELGAELRLPLSELEVAFRHPLSAEPAAVLPRFQDELAAYLREHLRARSPDGRAWTIEVTRLTVARDEQPVDLVARLRLRPPAGASPRRLTLHGGVVLHEVMNHFILVSVRSDWNHAQWGERPELIGTLHSYSPDLEIDREEGSVWRGFRAVVGLGIRHIAEGTDHLLFLFLLLLVAPLGTANHRWAGPVGLRTSAGRLVGIVTAFTFGHSVTLVVGTLGWLRLPERAVEVAIAASVLASAIHALRPCFAGREPAVAAGFGLVHGLGFATALGTFQLDATRKAAALLAFNLGLEIVQLAIVAAVAPLLVVLSHRPAYRLIRTAGGIAGGTAALAWIAERALG